MSAGPEPSPQNLVRLSLRLWSRYRRRMLFFSSCIAAGVAFLVGIGNLLASVEAAVGSKARELLAADVELSSHRPFDARIESFLYSLENEGIRTNENISFASMATPRTPKGKEPFLVMVKAVDEKYPFYGTIETRPPGVRPRNFEAVLDQSAALERGIKTGDKIRLGNAELSVIGLLTKEPDKAFSGFNLAPRLLISKEAVGPTGLLRFGSRVTYRRLLALPPGKDLPEHAAALKERLERELDDPYLSISSYADAEPSVREAVERASSFFVLLSLVALLLGAVGMSAGVTMFLNEQAETAAILRVLGLTPGQVGKVYGLLCLGIGLQGGLLGAAAGWALSAGASEAAPRLLGLLVPVTAKFSMTSLLEGMALALVLAVALNFAKVRALAGVAPMEVFRDRVRLPADRRTAAALILAGGVGLFLYAFAKSHSWRLARGFALALAGASAASAVLILGALALAGAAAPLWSGSFSARHGMLQLTRNRARTLVFLFTLSLGLTLLGALGAVHRSLRGEIMVGRSPKVPDHFLIDIQKSQLAGVQTLIARHAPGPSNAAPLIRARLTHLDGRPIVRKDDAGLTVEEKTRRRFLTREYNLTYKDILQDSEEVIAGKFWKPGETGAQISLEESFAERIGAGMGHVLTFDVQGRPVEGTVTSLRRVRWNSMAPNFFVVFPAAVLEAAPQTIIASVKVSDPSRAAAFRSELTKAYPNVSAIDLTKVLDNIQAVLGTLIGALDILAWFCVGVGLLVLGGTLGLGRKERLETAALYRALGCTRRDLILMDAAEFTAIGILAFGIAAATSHLLGWALARRMGVAFAPDPGAVLQMLAAGLILPVATGLAVNWKAYGTGVLESLRKEA